MSNGYVTMLISRGSLAWLLPQNVALILQANASEHTRRGRHHSRTCVPSVVYNVARHWDAKFNLVRRKILLSDGFTLRKPTQMPNSEPSKQPRRRFQPITRSDVMKSRVISISTYMTRARHAFSPKVYRFVCLEIYQASNP